MEGMLTNLILDYLKSTRGVPKNIENIKVDIKILLNAVLRNSKHHLAIKDHIL